MRQIFAVLLLMLLTFEIRCDCGCLEGRGSTFSRSVFKEIEKEILPGYTFSYLPSNSFKGFVSLLENSCELSGTEINFKEEKKERKFSPILTNKTELIDSKICLPTFMEGLVLIYNLNQSYSHFGGVERVKLTMDVILGIFNGKIKNWNNEKIEKLNNEIPNAEIKFIFRSEPCGTTFLFSKALSNLSPTFATKYGASSFINWDLPFLKNRTIESDKDVFDNVKETPFSIGFISYGSFLEFSKEEQSVKIIQYYDQVPIDCSTKTIENAVVHSPFWNSFNFSKGMQTLPPIKNFYLINIKDKKEETYQIWPFVFFNFMCFHSNQTKEAALHLENFFISLYSMIIEGYSTKVSPIPDDLRDLSLHILKKKMTCNNGKPCFEVFGYEEALFFVKIGIIAIFLFGIFLTIILLSAVFTNRKIFTSIEDQNEKKSNLEIKDLLDDLSVKEIIGKGSFSQIYKANWKGTVVSVKKYVDLSKNEEDVLKKKAYSLNFLRHPNIVQFLGFSSEGNKFFMIYEYCEMGNLQEILMNKSLYELSNKILIRFALDCSTALEYLHSFDQSIHNDFTIDIGTKRLLVDKNWNVKVGSGFSLSNYRKKARMQSKLLNIENENVYSFGVTLYEIFTRSELKKEAEEDKNINTRDSLPDFSKIEGFPMLITNELESLIKRCLSKDHLAFSQIRIHLTSIQMQMEEIERKKMRKKMKIFKMNKDFVADSYERMENYLKIPEDIDFG